MKKVVALFVAACVNSSLLFAADEVVYTKVKVHFAKDAQKDRRMVDKDIDLLFDDGHRWLVTRGIYAPTVVIGYDQVEKIVFDVSMHMRGGAMSQLIGGIPGVIMAAQHIHDYWLLIRYNEKGSTKTYLMEIDKEHASQIIERAQSTFPGKVEETPFKFGDDIPKASLSDINSKHDVKVDKKNHPMPDLQPGKALLVVACPSLAARSAGSGAQYKLHANDKVVIVNKQGTYSFANLDPGEYTLVSQGGENANGFKLTLEPDKEYYFFQNIFMGAFRLSQQSKERVMQEITGSYYSDWKRK